MANLQQVQQGRCHISFVRERGMTPPLHDIPPRLFMGGGNRNNVWRTFSTRDYAMAVCNLTGNKNGQSAARHVKWRDEIYSIPARASFLPQLNRLSPANVTVTLDCLKYEYNKDRKCGTICAVNSAFVNARPFAAQSIIVLSLLFNS